MRAYGIDRNTRDLDLWVARDPGNAEALTRFMRQFQNLLPPLERLQQPNFKFTVGDPAHPEVDILTSVAGDPPFDACLARAERRLLDGHRVTVVAASDLVAIKEASAERMERDAADPMLLEADRALALRTAVKERRDVMILKGFLGMIGPGG